MLLLDTVGGPTAACLGPKIVLLRPSRLCSLVSSACTGPEVSGFSGPCTKSERSGSMEGWRANERAARSKGKSGEPRRRLLLRERERSAAGVSGGAML